MARGKAGLGLKPPTVKEVAERARTSIATVSYVLSNKDRYLRPELREAVLQAAQDLGYVKNAAASSLKGARRGILAVLVPQFGNNFFTRICVEIEAEAQQAGFIVTICNSDESPEKERRILERLVSQRIDGCILSTALSRPGNFDLMQRHQVPYVVLERTPDGNAPEHDFVGQDNFQSGHLATRALLEAGHRRIGFAGWASPIPNIHDRAEGYLAALKEAGITPQPGWLLLDELTEEAGRRMAEQLTRLDLTALVIAHHHTMAKGVLLGLADRNLRWPDDLSIVLIGTPEWHDLVRPSLACILRPEAEMGRQATALLIRKIENPDHVGPAMVLPTSFIAGQSIRRINQHEPAAPRSVEDSTQ